MHPTFEDAAHSYVAHGGEARYVPRLIPHLGPKPIHLITPLDVYNLAHKLQEGHKNGTKNRSVITPCRAILYHAHDLGWRTPVRLRMFKVTRDRNRKPATRRWMETFLEQCDLDGLQHLAACVLFMNQTAARVTEAIELRWEQVDLFGKKALLLKTKTEINSYRFLTDHLLSRLLDLSAEAKDPQDRVFRYSSRYGVNDRIQEVCKRSGLPYKSSHLAGRHSFATNALNAGISVRTAMDAGGWRSSVVFLETYSHTIDAGLTVASAFNMIHHRDQF